MSKKKLGIILIIIVIIALVFGIIYSINSNATTTITTSNTIKLNNKSVTITKGGTYNITGTLKNGDITINTDSDVKLILNNVTINNKSSCINVIKAKNVYIETKGTNSLTSTALTSEQNGTIYSKSDLFLLGTGILNIKSNIDGIISKDDLQIDSGTYNIVSDDDGIIGRDSIVVNNGKINITSKGDGIKTTNEEKGNIEINNGKFNITSSMDAIQSIKDLVINDGTFNIKTGSGSTTTSQNNGWLNSGETDSIKGLKSSGNIYINKGSIDIESEDDRIHSNSNVEIKSATINIKSGDDGIHANNIVNIKSGTINISQSYEGIEGSQINISGGDVSVTASDDGINVNGGNDGSSMNGRPGQNNVDSTSASKLTISGGKIRVASSGDGLDSNGNIYINGGTVYVDGPTNDGNGALDYDGEFVIKGGTIIAVGSSGMAQNASDSSTQNTVLVNLTSSYSGKITFGDLTYTPSKSYSSILISSSKLSTGKTYSLKIDNNEVESVTISDTITNIGNNFNGMMNRGFEGNVNR